MLYLAFIILARYGYGSDFPGEFFSSPIAVGILLISNPVDWSAALVIGAGGSFIAGKGTANVYTSLGKEADAAHFTTIVRLLFE